MRKLLFLSATLAFVLSIQAQDPDNEKKAALDLLQKNRSATGLSAADLDNSVVTSTYVIPGTDIRMLYLQQQYQDIPVYNQLQVMAFKNEQLASNQGSRIPMIEQRTLNASARAAISPEMAVQAAMNACQLTPVSTITPQKISANGRKLEYGDLAVSNEAITAELIWFPVADGKEVKLVWQVFLAPRKSSAYWLIRVDANTKQVINKENLTIYCNWDKKGHSVEEHIGQHHPVSSVTPRVTDNPAKNQVINEQAFVVNNSSYRVIPFPAESPNHPGGAHALRTNPWTLAPGNASSLGWQYDGTVYYTNTRGNNVYAYEDRNSTDLPGLSPVSVSSEPDLSFDFTPDYNLEPTVTAPSPNQQFNTTNLFYWNNIIHDLAYIYGFNEAARNFQQDNQGRGGLGADYVLAEAQDGSGTNNANFAPTPDGTRPRMQMFLWTAPTPDRDGDVDNGIIVHEYTHGISNRLTGSGLGCLSNAEQMGEGWSDYFALMTTQDWSTSLPGDGFSKPRGMGTYALNQPTTGPGIRQYPYTTDMTVNPLTYANLASATTSHATGTIWCTVLWDMTWEIIQAAGINPSLHAIASGGGNAIALKLVVEGLRLQPCSPGFIDGRNAILKADTLFFGGQYSCAIMRAFARRGMGIGASQGSSNSRTDQTVSYTGCTPGVCASPSALASSAITTNSATVSWTAAFGAASYNVDYKTNASATWINAATATTATSVNLTGLTVSTLYDWRVRTNCSSNSSDYLQAQFTTASPNTCPGIYDVSTNGTMAGAATIPLNTDVKGLINISSDMDYYKFQITNGGTITVNLTTLPDNYDLRLFNAGGTRIGESKKAGTNSESIALTVAAGTYYAQVLPKGAASNANSCYTLRVVTGTASFGEEQLIVDNSTRIYPNPVREKLFVSTTGLNGPSDIRVFDMVGKMLIQKSSTQANTAVDVSSLKPGFYLVKVGNNGKESMIKIVKE